MQNSIKFLSVLLLTTICLVGSSKSQFTKKDLSLVLNTPFETILREQLFRYNKAKQFYSDVLEGGTITREQLTEKVRFLSEPVALSAALKLTKRVAAPLDVDFVTRTTKKIQEKFQFQNDAQFALGSVLFNSLTFLRNIKSKNYDTVQYMQGLLRGVRHVFLEKKENIEFTQLEKEEFLNGPDLCKGEVLKDLYDEFTNTYQAGITEKTKGIKFLTHHLALYNFLVPRLTLRDCSPEIVEVVSTAKLDLQKVSAQNQLDDYSRHFKSNVESNIKTLLVGVPYGGFLYGKSTGKTRGYGYHHGYQVPIHAKRTEELLLSLPTKVRETILSNGPNAEQLFIAALKKIEKREEKLTGKKLPKVSFEKADGHFSFDTFIETFKVYAYTNDLASEYEKLVKHF